MHNTSTDRAPSAYTWEQDAASQRAKDLMSVKEKIFPTLNRAAVARYVPAIEAGTAIPRILHQTFYERTLAPQLQANVDALRAANPGWEYRFYDDDDILRFIRENFPPAVLERFLRIDVRYGAARADLFRYLLMYKVGGVYLDIKSGAKHAFDSVLQPDDRFVLSYWNASNAASGWGQHYELRDIAAGELQQWHIVCAPGHPFMKAVIDTVLANIDTYVPSLHGVGKNGVLRATGPIAYTRAIHRILALHPHRVVDSEHDLGLTYNIYRNQSHETAFKSHYSVQVHPLVRLGFGKRQMTRFWGLVQWTYDVVTGRRRKMHA
jgi:mannosyltransferase OCH1-like enzyme